MRERERKLPISLFDFGLRTSIIEKERVRDSERVSNNDVKKEEKNKYKIDNLFSFFFTFRFRSKQKIKSILVSYVSYK